jgi:outer membrane PBP1 activator LpoA protein
VAIEGDDVLERSLAWVRGHRQFTSWAGVVLLVAAGLFYWNRISTEQSERVADSRLGSARLAFESNNYPLAASELSQITVNYAGTNAAQQATLLLAQVRMLQGQSDQASQMLTAFASSASSAYRAQAYGLLGATYENTAHPREAADAYQKAAGATAMPFLKAQYLSDAGRAWTTSGDTVAAVKAYQEIATTLDSTGTATEAKVRLGELTKGTWKAPQK